MPTKRNDASGIVVNRLRIPALPAEPPREISAEPQSFHSITRAAGISCGARAPSRAAPSPRALRWRRPRRCSFRRATRDSASRYPRTITGCRRSSKRTCAGGGRDVLKNRQNFSDWSMTPLQHQYGIITPNGLFYERHHSGTPDIDPAKHKLVIHGLVKAAARVQHERSAPLPFRFQVLFPRVLGQRSHRLAQACVHHRPADRMGCSRARNGRAYRFPGSSTRPGSCRRRNGSCSKAPTAPAIHEACRSRRYLTTA